MSAKKMEARRRGGSFHVDSSDDDNNVLGAENSELKQAIRGHNIEVNDENDDTDSSDNSKDGR